MAVSSSSEGASLRGGAPLLGKMGGLRLALVLGLGAGLAYAAYVLHHAEGRGAQHALSLLLGVALGVTFERGRFCFFCIWRDFFQQRDSTGFYAILSALAVGSIGYALLFGIFLPNPFAGRLPPTAHIGPLHPLLLGAGLVFGLGMTLSGACISGHLYRLGQGYSRAPFALFGSLIGFGLGFFTWRAAYENLILGAEALWLPQWLGYSGSLILQLSVLGLAGLALLRFLPERPAQPAQKASLAGLWRALVITRWHPLVTGALVGLIGVAAYLRIEPLGVTAQLGSISRTYLENEGLLAGRLNGLDVLRGCATVVSQTVGTNGLLIGGLVAGSFMAALAGGRFKPSRLTLRNSLTALGGGVLMGWASMLALGCTVGTLLSGISAFALSGWAFGLATLAGVWLGLKLKLAV